MLCLALFVFIPTLSFCMCCRGPRGFLILAFKYMVWNSEMTKQGHYSFFRLLLYCITNREDLGQRGIKIGGIVVRVGIPSVIPFVEIDLVEFM
jgi:hypothetical protein